jgi:hypothetical protein
MQWSFPHSFVISPVIPVFLAFAARAYYLSSSQDPENLTRAEAALQELVATTENQVSLRFGIS